MHIVLFRVLFIIASALTCIRKQLNCLDIVICVFYFSCIYPIYAVTNLKGLLIYNGSALIGLWETANSQNIII